jgi:hypothetical protein
MACFETGVKRYIKTRAVVEVGFPVDWRDNADISCKHCNLFVRATQRCGLTQQIVNYPDRYIGECCPLEIIEEEVNENV